ncbi:hypothetical protein BKA82DRAFT_1007788 [Pisolithus tinctorius]|uniref:Uncharacterized protein n=1 Tax=Pisolithus tinctorius Marx 270 TaxID=870435 RepID=A0A0C3N1W9_PISTI|nr:hypothetical protein BKA82DRAFT_1007788 [Pisolithus tinctorius]KIN95074.1 hypothetical protein M404DRAFT_1007788 [Pisolithus tinctorius Marx 270]
MGTGCSRAWLPLQQILVFCVFCSPTVILAPPLIYPNNLAGIVRELVSHSHIRDIDLGGIYALGGAWELRAQEEGDPPTFYLLFVFCPDLLTHWLYTIFLSTHMLLWSCTLSSSIASQSLNAPSSRENPLSKTPKQHHDTPYHAGIETLLSVEGPKQLSTHWMRFRTLNRHRTTPFPSSSVLASPALAIREAVLADAKKVWESCWKVLLRDTVTVDSRAQRTDACMALVRDRKGMLVHPMHN